MKRYRRVRIAGGRYFFTVVTRHRATWLTDTLALARLREAFKRALGRSPFVIDAAVILPDHLHMIWRLPPGDADFSGRWRRIKHDVSIADPAWCWQPRFWEHRLRDERDWRMHMDYVHFNPVRHGHVDVPAEWPYSSLRRWIRMGVYAPGWGASGVAPDAPSATGE